MLASVGKPGPLMASVGKTLSPIPHQNVKNIRMANISGHKSRFQAFLKALPLYDWISAIFIIHRKWCLHFSCCRATSCSLSPSCVLSNMNGAISYLRIIRWASSTHHRWTTPISHVQLYITCHQNTADTLPRKNKKKQITNDFRSMIYISTKLKHDLHPS